MKKAQESVSVTVLHLEASRIALSMSDGNVQKPTPVYAINASGYIPRGINSQKQDNYISTGIYRCTTLDIDRNFARISRCQESARINAFLCIFTTSRSANPRPVVGSDEPHPTGVVCEAVCNRKGNNKSRYCELIMLKNIISQKTTTPREVKASRGGVVRKSISYFGLL